MLSTTWLSGMVSRVRCLVAYLTCWALLLFVLAVSDRLGSCGSVAHCYAPSLLGLPYCSALQLVSPMGLLGSFEFGTSIPAFVPERCLLVVWGSLVNYVPMFLVCLAFEYYVLACLEFHVT